MYTFELCRQYQIGLKKASLEEVLPLFAPDAVVVTPLSGTLGVQAFHEKLFRNTRESIVKLHNVFEAMTQTPAVALQLHHTWVLRDGTTIGFDCVSIFDFTAQRDRFTRLTLVYDTAGIRRGLSERQIVELGLA